MSVNAAREANHFMFNKIVLALAITACPIAAATAQNASPQISMGNLIDQYEAFAQSGDPEADARAREAQPHRWGDVTPAYIAQRAATAQSMLDALNRLPNRGEGPEAAILRHLLQGEIDRHAFDTARIPLVGDWGFFAEPHFAAMNTRLTSREDAEAWIDRLNDVPRYFAENIVIHTNPGIRD